MALRSGEEPVEDDEFIFRRVQLRHYKPQSGAVPAVAAFLPTDLDTTGLSVQREKYKSIRDAAKNPRGKQYCVARLCVGDLRKQGIEVVPRPLHAEVPAHPDYDPGHAELPQIIYSERKSDHVVRLSTLLASKLCVSIEGPYP